MNFGDFIRTLHKGVKGLNLKNLGVELFKAANDKIWLSEEAVKNWIDGKNKGYEKQFKDKSFDDYKFIEFLRKRTIISWRDIQTKFKEFENTGKIIIIDCNTNDMNFFLKSIMLQFKELTGVPVSNSEQKDEYTSYKNLSYELISDLNHIRQIMPTLTNLLYLLEQNDTTKLNFPCDIIYCMDDLHRDISKLKFYNVLDDIAKFKHRYVCFKKYVMDNTCESKNPHLRQINPFPSLREVKINDYSQFATINVQHEMEKRKKGFLETIRKLITLEDELKNILNTLESNESK